MNIRTVASLGIENRLIQDYEEVTQKSNRLEDWGHHLTSDGFWMSNV